MTNTRKAARRSSVTMKGHFVLLFVILAFLAQTPVSFSEAVPAASTKSLACESETLGGDHRDIKCPLEGSGSAQRFRFKANFSGGHDDTTAAMTITFDGAPLVCDEGSKTTLMGEDGDVSLECKFSVTQKIGTKHTLGVTLLWGHAQYSSIELLSE